MTDPLSDTAPHSVRMALSLMWWAFGVHAFLCMYMLFSDAGVAFAIALVVLAFLPWAIGRRWNWARIAQQVLIVNFVAFYGIALWKKPDFSLTFERIFDYTMDIIRFGFHLTAAALLLRKDARLWFRQVRAAKQVSAV